MVWSVGFLLLGTLLVIACIPVLLSIADYQMSGSDAIRRDGLARGDTAPKWQLRDSAGELVRSPSGGALQLILFADHSLKSFPTVIEQARNLLEQVDPPELVVLLRSPNELAKPLLDVVGLGAAKVCTGSAGLYGRYNVRVMPFAMFVDGEGRVMASSLVNHGWQIVKLWSLANIALDDPARPVDKVQGV